ncbi:LUD domain-containing protein [Actinoplanes sp. NPDC026670]|uniref:LutC/YkgG family protein n=1 Tax=Actinoplanes sp. NPDC026670 TaxID=3154700 RepID=UPI0033D43865
MTDARTEILARLRTALADEPAAEPIPRDYGRTRDGDLTALLADRLTDYQAVVHRSLVDALRPLPRIAVPADLPPAWLDGYPGEAVVDDGLTPAELEAVGAALTGCAAVIAETGTIVLDAGPAQGRRALSLIPDVHVVVIRPGQIVGRVPDVFDRLTPGRPQTWISGPSATSDIELNRVEGVHGPRRLHVVLPRAAGPNPTAK